MHEGFTDCAIRVLRQATEVARQYNHNYIGTEHILFSLLTEGSNMFRNLGKDPNAIRVATLQHITPQSDQGTIVCPYTPRARKAIEYAREEAKSLSCAPSTEHILLGLIREADGIAARVLTYFGLKLHVVQEALQGNPK